MTYIRALETAFNPPAPTLQPPITGRIDIRTFAAEKEPKTLSQKLAVIGYYLAYSVGVAGKLRNL